MKNKILTITFCLFISGIFIINLFTPDQELSYAERRYLKKLPDLTITNLLDGTISNNFESYSLDHFISRDRLRTLKSLIELNLFNKQDNNKLYYHDNHIFKMEYPLQPNKVIGFTNKMNYLYDNYLTNMNVYYSIIPDKNYYSQDNYLKLNYQELFTLVSDNLNPNIKYIDITNSLSLDDYYYTDIHWRQQNLTKVVNTLSTNMNFQVSTNYKENKYYPFYGSYYGQLALSVKPDELIYLTNDLIDNAVVEDFDSDTTTIYELDSLGKMDSYDVYLSGATPIIEMTNPNSETERELIIFRDSFSSSLAPLLLEGYSKITLLDLRYISISMLKDYVTFNNQDILILYNTTIINNSDMIKK